MADSPNRDSKAQASGLTLSHHLPQTPQAEEPKYHPVSISDEVEPIEFYQPGGYCPIKIGDVLDDRFEVFHKLGYGGTATVWLCHEYHLKEWRAVKINAASFSFLGCADLRILEALKKRGISNKDLEENHLALPLDIFWKESPNGRHLCSVLPVLGPKLSDWREKMGRDQTLVNKLCRQLTAGLKCLHDQGICHGDFRPQNILMRLKAEGLNSMDKEKLAKLLVEPDIEDVFTVSGDKSPNAPDFVVAALNWEDLRDLMSDDIAIVDFGEAFKPSNPPEKLGIPEHYAAPEILFDIGRPGFASDVWSLACTLLAVKMDTFTGMELWDVIRRMEYFIGPLPPRFRNRARQMLYKQKIRRWEKGILKKKPKPPSFDLESDEALKPVTGKKSTALEDEWVEGSEYADPIEIYLGSEQFQIKEADDLAEESELEDYGLPRREVLPLADLLRKMLKYDAEERLKLPEAVKHEWFVGKKKNVAPKEKPLLLIKTGFTEALWVRSLLAVIGVALIAVGLATVIGPSGQLTESFWTRFCRIVEYAFMIDSKHRVSMVAKRCLKPFSNG